MLEQQPWSPASTETGLGTNDPQQVPDFQGVFLCCLTKSMYDYEFAVILISIGPTHHSNLIFDYINIVRKHVHKKQSSLSILATMQLS